MFARRWIIAATLGLTLATSGQAQEQTSPAGNDAESQQIVSDKLPIPLPVQLIYDEESSEARQRSEAESSQREIDDLIAQQGMNAATQEINVATQNMTYYARMSTFLVAIGTSLVLVSLFLAIRANTHAYAAVEVTRKLGEAQMRAYPAIIPSHKWNTVHGVDQWDSVSFSFAVKNTGQTPATILDSAFVTNDIRYGQMPIIDPFSAIDPDTRDNKKDFAPSVHSRIGAGETSDSFGMIRPIAHIETMVRENKVTVMGITHIYEDVFGDRFRMKCSYVLHIKEIPKAGHDHIKEPISLHFEYTPLSVEPISSDEKWSM